MIGRLRAKVHARREQWRKARLRFWLRLMADCEKRGLTDCEGYFWIARRAMGCNAWKPRTNGNES